MPLIIGAEHDRMLSRLTSCKVILHGHFELSSGRHSDRYLDKRLFIRDMEEDYDQFCAMIATCVIERGYGAMVAPEAAGVLVAERVLNHLHQHNYKIVYAPVRKTDLGLALDDVDKPKIFGKCTAIIEDVITTGDTAVKVAELVSAAGASANAIHCLFERGYHGRVGGMPVRSVMSVDLPDWIPPCRLCQRGVPISPKPMGRPQLPFTD